MQLAQIAYITSAVNGGKGNFKDFLITHHEPNKRIGKIKYEDDNVVKSIFSAVSVAK